MRVLGVITARGGSKGIPRKNILPLHGKPLIAWTIEAVKESRLLTDCVVSTDDQEIAEIAKRFGASVPFLRPATLSTDEAKSLSVIQHAITWMEEHKGESYDAVMILQPTSPFRTSTDIDASITKMIETDADSVMSMVKLIDVSLPKLKRIEGDRIFPFTKEGEGSESSARHDLPDVYKRNCAVYLTKVSFLMKGDLFGEDSRAYIMPEERSVDINTKLDFSFAEFLVKQSVK